jgi:hypothetical protein
MPQGALCSWETAISERLTQKRKEIMDGGHGGHGGKELELNLIRIESKRGSIFRMELPRRGLTDQNVYQVHN